MRLLEILTMLTLIIASLGYLATARRRPRWLAFLPPGALVLIMLHLLIEGGRWQMWPAYVLAVLFSLVNLWRLLVKQASAAPSLPFRVLRALGAVLGLLFTLAAVLLPVLLPVFSLPQPTGPYPVGTVSFLLEDVDRPESFTDDPDDYRQLPVRVWYPAATTAGSDPVSYLAPGDGRGRMLSEALALPGFVFSYLHLVKTHAHPEVPCADDQSAFPVLLFSHAYNPGFPEQNTIQMEELASHGYIVCSVAHPYEASGVLFPGKGVVTGSRKQFRAIQEERRRSYPLFVEYRDARGSRKLSALLGYLESLSLLRESEQRWVEDLFFVAEKLGDIDSGVLPSPLVGKLDRDRLGVFGMELGGSAAGRACQLSDQFKAGLNYDGRHVGEPLDIQSSQPFMAMYSEYGSGMNDILYERMFERSYSVTVAGARLFNFNDFTIVSPVFKELGFLGPIDGAAMAKIVNAYTLAFFDKSLKGQPAPLLEGDRGQFPQATVVKLEGLKPETEEDEAGSQH